MEVVLLRIPRVDPSDETEVKIRALSWGNENSLPKSPVLKTLSEWSVANPAAYKQIIQSMKRVAQTRRGSAISEKYVKKCKSYDDVYEFRSRNSTDRVMFFYFKDNSGEIAICTESITKKTKSEQNAAFKRCYETMKFFKQQAENNKLKITDEGERKTIC